MKKAIEGLQVYGNKLRHWSPLLDKWASLINRYCFLIGEDAPYFYNERANIGVLSAAAWQVGWVALEEFGNRKRGKKYGRADLYIGPSDRDAGEYIEAKLSWDINKTHNALLRAIDDVEKVRLPKGDVGIAIAFVSPGIKEEYEPKIDEKIKGTIETAKQIAKQIKSDAIAWSFPRYSRILRGGGKYEHLIYPGVLLLAKRVDK